MRPFGLSNDQFIDPEEKHSLENQYNKKLSEIHQIQHQLKKRRATLRQLRQLKTKSTEATVEESEEDTNLTSAQLRTMKYNEVQKYLD